MVAMGTKLLGRWDIPDGEGYKQSEKFFYCRQLGMTFREIGEKFGVRASTVQQSINKRDLAVRRHIEIKAIDEQRLGMK